MRQRVLAYVTRERDGRIELLVFDQRDDPDAGTQVPAGRLDPGESLEQGLLRELHEEAGLDGVRIVRELPILGEWADALALREPRLRGARRREDAGLASSTSSTATATTPV